MASTKKFNLLRNALFFIRLFRWQFILQRYHGVVTIQGIFNIIELEQVVKYSLEIKGFICTMYQHKLLFVFNLQWLCYSWSDIVLISKHQVVIIIIVYIRLLQDSLCSYSCTHLQSLLTIIWHSQTRQYILCSIILSFIYSPAYFIRYISTCSRC